MPAGLRSVVSQVDASLFHWVIDHRSSLLNPAMIVLGHCGGLVWAGAMAVLALVFRGRWAGAYQALLAIGLAALLADVAAKPLIARHRPFVTFNTIEIMAKPQRSGSFPSTHAAASFAGAFAASRVFPELRVAFWLIATLVAVARVYLGVHYPLDVIAGAVIGICAGGFAVAGTRWRRPET